MTDESVAVNEPMAPDDAVATPPSRTERPTAPRPGQARRRFTGKFSARSLVLIVASLVVGYLGVVPVVAMLYASVRDDFLSPRPGTWTLNNFTKTLTDSSFPSLLGTSIVYAASSALIATVLGFGLAYLAGRTNARFRFLIWVSALFPLIMPGILGTMAWALLLSPNAGPVNDFLGVFGLPAFNVYSLKGMIFVEATHLTALSFLMGTASVAGLDPSLEDSARTAGASPWKVLTSITLPLLRPAIVSVSFLMFVLAISSFEVPQLIGVPGRQWVFVSRIYTATLRFPPDYGQIGALGFYILVIATAGLIVTQRIARRSRTATITGKNFVPTRIKLGKYRVLATLGTLAFFAVNVLMPFAILVWASLIPSYATPSFSELRRVNLDNYFYVFRNQDVINAFVNTVISSIAAGVLVTLLAAVVAFISVKTKVRGRGVLDFLSMVPLAVPSIIIGLGLLYWYLVAPLPFPVYGTLIILVIAYVTTALPYSMQYMIAGLNQIDNELEEASSASGATWLHTMRRIYVPLLKPAFFASLLWGIMLAFREVTSVILLYTSKTEVLSIRVYNLWGKGESYPKVAAIGVSLTLLLILLTLVLFMVGGSKAIARSTRL